jgi:DNA-binding response OmpR family regulator
VNRRVLVVEDEPNIANAIRYLLDREGFDVEVESDGARAVGRTEGAAIVILDVMLPNKSGFDVLRDLRAGANPNIPVLMLTARGQARDRQVAEDLGVTRFMTKPFSNTEFVATVKDLAGE